MISASFGLWGSRLRSSRPPPSSQEKGGSGGGGVVGRVQPEACGTRGPVWPEALEPEFIVRFFGTSRSQLKSSLR